MNKTKVIGIIVLVILIVMVALMSNDISENILSDEEKNNLLENIKIENENVLRNNNTVTISGNIKNYNKQSVKIKNINVVLNDESGNKLMDIEIKIDKLLKSNGMEKYSKDVKINNYSQRVFTDYSIEI